MTLIEDFINTGTLCDSRELLRPQDVIAYTIHWTGVPNQSTKQVRNYWVTSGGEASAHFVVKDDEVRQCWPVSKVAWHCGDKQGNHKTIGIEVIPEDADGVFSAQSIKTVSELLVLLDHLLGKRNPLPIIRHYDWSGKECPKYYVPEERWAKLKFVLGRD